MDLQEVEEVLLVDDADEAMVNWFGIHHNHKWVDVSLKSPWSAIISYFYHNDELTFSNPWRFPDQKRIGIRWV